MVSPQAHRVEIMILESLQGFLAEPEETFDQKRIAMKRGQPGDGCSVDRQDHNPDHCRPTHGATLKAFLETDQVELQSNPRSTTPRAVTPRAPLRSSVPSER